MSEYNPYSINAALSRIETKLDSIDRRLKDGDERMEEHGKRLGILENWRWYIIGVCATVAFFVTWIIHLLKP